MLERRCFVQFIHPGGEHRPDGGGLRFWNRGLHRRKFLKSRGRYLDRGALKEGEIVFWGEWEPESRVVARYLDHVADGPRFLYEPFFVDDRDRAWRQNTDPLSSAPSSTTWAACNTPAGGRRSCGFWRLARSSCSAPAERRPASWSIPSSSSASSDHSGQDWEQKLDGRIYSTYRKVTVEPWYRGSVPEAQSHRLYFGATPQDPAGQLFSFVPCQPYDQNRTGVARPEVRIPGFITPHLTQGNR
jgi:hypothetical protein